MNSVTIIREAIEYRKQQESLDPVHWFVLTSPDGSQMGDIVEMHVSECARRNESRMAAYMASQKRREDARKEWLAKHEETIRLNKITAFAQGEIVARTRTAEVPIPETASALTRRLVASRKQNVTEIDVPFFIPEPEPAITYSAADHLWTRTLDVQGRVIRVEGTRRGKHD